MAEDQVTVRQWIDVVRRARLGRTVKGVAVMISTYADYTNGRRVFPGIARVCVDSELSYDVVSAAFRTLREAGLIERVSYGSRRRAETDEYRLTIRADVLDHVTVLSPADVTERAAAIAAENSGRTRNTRPETHLPPVPSGANDADLPPMPSGANVGLAPDETTRKTVEAESFAPDGVGCNPGFAPDGVGVLPPTPSGPTMPLPTHLSSTNHLVADLRTAVTGVDAPAADESELILAAGKCDHGLPATARADGLPSCAFCRRAAGVTAPPSKPIFAAPNRPERHLRAVPAIGATA